MEEFIKKLIGRLSEEIKKINDEPWLDCEERIKKQCIYCNTIKIVNQLAEEYAHCTLCYLQSPCEYQNKNAEMRMEYWERGWIPCEKELPKETGCYLVTYRKNGELLVGYWLFNGIDFNQTENVEVLYWQPLPEPYKPKGE